MESTLATTEKNFLFPIGYDNIILDVSNLIKYNNLPTVNLICAPKGSGKRLFCEYLASIILDLNSASYSNLSFHPDLLIIDNDNLASNKKEITVDLTRKIKDFLYLTPSQAKCQMVIIDAVDSLNTHAANSILKILEESALNKYFLLICHNPDKILDTIKSRCHKINLPKLNKQNFCDIINSNNQSRIETDNLELLYEIFPEQPGLAINFVENQGIEMLKKMKNINSSFMEIKGFSSQYDWKDLNIFNNFYTIINYLIYQNITLFNQNGNLDNVIKLEKFSSKIKKYFSTTMALNLDRKNFIIDSINQFKTAII